MNEQAIIELIKRTSCPAKKAEIIRNVKALAKAKRLEKQNKISKQLEAKATAQRKAEVRKHLAKMKRIKEGKLTEGYKQPCHIKLDARDKYMIKSEEYCTEKFNTFRECNEAIDAKVTEGMTIAEKRSLTDARFAASRNKAKLVANQTHATVPEIGAGSCKGFFFPDGGRPVRGKEKIKKKGSAPRVEFKGR